MNKFLEYLKNTNTVICCSDFEELFQFFRIMKDNGYELDDKMNGKYNFLINNNKTFEFTVPTYFDNILFPAFRKKINSCDMLWNGMTLEKAHRKMWNDLADGKVKNKREWVNLYNTNNESDPDRYCFACEEARRIKIKVDKDSEIYDKDGHKLMTFYFSNNICGYCPLGGGGNSKQCLDGLYDKFSRAEGFEKFKLAHEIANLPWNEVYI